MRIRTLLLLLLAAPLCAVSPTPNLVGVYSNIVVTGEHASGYQVELWDVDGQYTGLIYYAAGLSADLPVGQLEDIRFDPKRKTLLFKAKMSIGVATSNGESWTPTRDLLQFDGSLFTDQLTGDLVRADKLHPNRAAIHELVKLYRNRDKEKEVPQPKDIAEWSERVRILLRDRGPKW